MCGFTDIRQDAKGYICSVCGKRMHHNWLAEIVAMGLGGELKKVLKNAPSL